jgi:NADPH:quinone reductase-like Zn-dependent oxidoreductase
MSIFFFLFIIISIQRRKTLQTTIIIIMTGQTVQAVVTENNKSVLKEIPYPTAAAGTVVVKNTYLGINYADLFQVSGNYPLPPSGVVGLEG